MNHFRRFMMAIFAFLFLMPWTAQAETLCAGWWDAGIEDLRAARNQICEVLGEPQDGFGTELHGEVNIFLDGWEQSEKNELWNALSQLESQIDYLVQQPTPTPTPSPTPTPTPAVTFTPVPPEKSPIFLETQGANLFEEENHLVFSGNAGDYVYVVIPAEEISERAIHTRIEISELSGEVKMDIADAQQEKTELLTFSAPAMVTLSPSWQDLREKLELSGNLEIRLVLTQDESRIVLNSMTVGDKKAILHPTETAEPVQNEETPESSEETAEPVPTEETVIVPIVGDAPIIPNKALVIGNTLLIGFGEFGMCAPSVDEDYYHLVNACILEKNSDFTMSKAFGGALENVTDSESFDANFNGFASKLTEDLDLVIVQFGDNINTPEKLAYFKEEGAIRLFTRIRERCPHARICWVGAWFFNEEKMEIFKEACEKTGVICVDISDLRTEENGGKVGDIITYPDGRTETVENEGIARMPGKAGMLAIANRICYTLGITESEDAIQGK